MSAGAQTGAHVALLEPSTIRTPEANVYSVIAKQEVTRNCAGGIVRRPVPCAGLVVDADGMTVFVTLKQVLQALTKLPGIYIKLPPSDLVGPISPDEEEPQAEVNVSLKVKKPGRGRK